MRNFTSNRLAFGGLIVFLVIFLIVLIGPVFNPIDLSEKEETQINVAPGLNMMKVPDGLKGNVKFEHVKFGYNPENIVIKDFNADVHEGQKIAIVGPTGAGKSTMVKLLMRFYDVSSGAILVDGHDIRDYNRADLRDAFGMVLQDTCCLLYTSPSPRDS